MWQFVGVGEAGCWEEGTGDRDLGRGDNIGVKSTGKIGWAVLLCLVCQGGPKREAKTSDYCPAGRVLRVGNRGVLCGGGGHN
jgi:hypothetical protein